MPAAPPSIARRLAWTLLASVLLWTSAVSLAVWLAVRGEVNELLDDTLQGAAEALRPTLQERPGGPATPQRAPAASSRYAWQLVAYPAGSAPQVLQASTRAPPQPFVGTPSPGFSSTSRWRIYGTPLAAGGGPMLFVAQSQAEQREAVREVVLGAALSTLAVALLAHLWLRWRLRAELQPLQRLSDRLRTHDLLAPQATLGPAERQELQPIHRALDDLAAQLSRRLAHERAFSAQAAHALRTPLAGIDAQLAMALREAPESLQPRLQRVRSAAGRLQRVVAALLALFRSGVSLQRETIDLAALQARLPVEGLDVQVAPGAALQADADLLSAALLNLLDNAARHGARCVQLSTPSLRCLQVSDDGPGLSDERRAALQAALDADDPQGHAGLGLVLVQLVARAHGGRLLLLPATQGFAVQLAL